MLLKLLIITAIIVGFLVLSMALKIWMGKEDEDSHLSCNQNEDTKEQDKSCAGCQIKELVNCTPEKRKELLSPST